MSNRVSATWQLLERSTGDAHRYLTNARTDGATYEGIAGDLARDFGIVVSREWVRLQCKRLGIVQGVAA